MCYIKLYLNAVTKATSLYTGMDMKKIEIAKIDITARNYNDVLKQTEYHIASATARGISVLKIICDPDATLSRVVQTSLKRAARKCKTMGKIEFFIFGENFKEYDAATDYLCQRCSFAKDDEDFGKGNKNIVIVYINSNK